MDKRIKKMSETEVMTTKKGGGKKNAIGDFYINKLDGDVMRKFIKQKKLEIDTEDQSDEQIAVSLFAHFDELDDEHKVKCDNCDGVSSDDLSLCPYCGEEGEVDEEEEAKADAEESEEEEAEEKPAKSKKPKAEEEDEEEESEEESEEDDSDDEEE